MIERSTEVLYWDVETGQYRYSPEAFDKYIQTYLEYIVASCQKLCKGSVSFSSYERSIMPEHIKETRRALKELLQPTLELSRLLHDTDRLPGIYTALRFRLLAIVNILEEQISRFLDLLHTYQVKCISSSEGEKWLRREIYSMFEKLSQYTLQLSERVQTARDDAKEQERKLLSLYENYPNWTGR
jgi:hypothetical protein